MATSSKKTVGSKPAAKAAGADSSAKPKAAPKPKTVATKTAGKTAVKTASAATEKSAAKAPAVKAEKPKAAKAEKAPAAPKAAKPKAEKAPVARKRPASWSLKAVPLREIDGKPGEPRLDAALAARERWHGRSGRPALKSGTQAVAFVRERMLVHPTVRSPLPNLIDPIVGRVCTEEERQSGLQFATLQAWRKELDRSAEILEVRLCFQRPTLVASELFPAVIAVASQREEEIRDGGVLSEEAEEALEVLDRKGVVPVDRLRQLVGLDAKTMDRVRAELESQLLVVARPDLDEDENPITALESLQRWADRTGARRADLEPVRAFTFLFIAALRSAVVLWPEEVAALFPWTPDERDAAIREAMATGAVTTYVEAGSTVFVASPVPR